MTLVKRGFSGIILIGLIALGALLFLPKPEMTPINPPAKAKPLQFQPLSPNGNKRTFRNEIGNLVIQSDMLKDGSSQYCFFDGTFFLFGAKYQYPGNSPQNGDCLDPNKTLGFIEKLREWAHNKLPEYKFSPADIEKVDDLISIAEKQYQSLLP